MDSSRCCIMIYPTRPVHSVAQQQGTGDTMEVAITSGTQKWAKLEVRILDQFRPSNPKAPIFQTRNLSTRLL